MEAEYCSGPQVTACLYTGISSEFFLNAYPVLCKRVERLAPLVWLRLEREMIHFSLQAYQRFY